MELFEQLRREYEFGIGTIKGVGRKFGVHRRLVRQAVNSALPPVRTYRQRSKPVLGAVEGFIDGILEAAGGTPRSRRSTSPGVKLVRDPVCGTYVTPGTALSLKSRGQTYYFCSEQCRTRFERG